MCLDKQNIDDEALSALMDGELSDFELRRLLSSCSDTPELTAKWSRLNAAQALMHNDANVTVSPSFAAGVFAAIDAEPAYSKHSESKVVGQVVSGLGKFAIAASVAAAVFIGMQTSLNNSSGVSPNPVAQSDSAVIPAMAVIASSDTGAFDPEAQQRLNEYIRSVSIQNMESSARAPQLNVLQDSQLIRQVNQIER